MICDDLGYEYLPLKVESMILHSQLSLKGGHKPATRIGAEATDVMGQEWTDSLNGVGHVVWFWVFLLACTIIHMTCIASSL